MPVIALRVSATWQVVALIPEGSVAGIKTGQKVTIIVPTAGITGVPGQVQQVIPTPVSTAQGVFYQAVITVTGRAANVPMNGMAADIKLGFVSNADPSARRPRGYPPRAAATRHSGPAASRWRSR